LSAFADHALPALVQSGADSTLAEKPRPALTLGVIMNTMKLTFFALIAVFVPAMSSRLNRRRPVFGKIFDRDLTSIEREIVPLAEAMPADKFDFAPSNGESKACGPLGSR